MGNKPKIYGFCPAGCKYETVHRSDVEDSAAFIKQHPMSESEGLYSLDVGRKYRIYTQSVDNQYSLRFYVNYKQDGEDLIHTFSLTEYDEYRDYVDFEILSVRLIDTNIVIVYEVNSERKTVNVEFTGTDVNSFEATDNWVRFATDVYAFNDGAINFSAISNMTFRDTVSEDTTQELKEIEINGDKWKIECTKFDIPKVQGGFGSSNGFTISELYKAGKFKVGGKYLVQFKTTDGKYLNFTLVYPEEDLYSYASMSFLQEGVGIVHLLCMFYQPASYVHYLAIYALLPDGTDISSTLIQMVDSIRAVELV